MATKIVNGDYAVDSHGCFIQGDYIDSVLQRAQLLLKVKKGSFSPDPSFGNELLTLDINSCTNETLKVYVSEALAPIREIELCDVERHVNKADNALSMTVYLRVCNKEIILEV